jgi:hypothetical protein
MSTASHASILTDLGTFIGNYWLWILIFWGVIGSIFEGIRDFFLECVTYPMKVRHRHRMEELRLQAKAAKKLAQAAALEDVPLGPCKHRHFTRVVDMNDVVVAWLCKDCDEQLPKDFAARQQDIPQAEEGA